MCLFTGTASGDEYELINIAQVVGECKNSAPKDPFVQTILGTIPGQALTHGIYTPNSLKKRFDNVFTECKKNALFPHSSNIVLSSLSNLYGKLLLFTVKPQYDNAEDFYKHGIDGMDTKDLLVQAKYFMDRQLVTEAVRCMIQLKGLPRHLAQDWISQARLFLEVHQASHTIIHYALSEGLNQIL